VCTRARARARAHTHTHTHTHTHIYSSHKRISRMFAFRSLSVSFVQPTRRVTYGTGCYSGVFRVPPRWHYIREPRMLINLPFERKYAPRESDRRLFFLFFFPFVKNKSKRYGKGERGKFVVSSVHAIVDVTAPTTERSENAAGVSTR